MRVLKSKKRMLKHAARKSIKPAIRRGDTVMVISGGHKDKRPLVGKTAKVAAIVGKLNDRVVLEGQNLVTKHQRQAGPDKPAGKVKKEASLHISNVMYYVEKLKKPVRLRHSTVADPSKKGKRKKVRGYIHPETKEFVQI